MSDADTAQSAENADVRGGWPGESVATIRDLNNRYGTGQERTLMCLNGHGDFTADLARYFCPRDSQRFLCPECDTGLGLQFRAATSERLAQRHG